MKTFNSFFILLFLLFPIVLNSQNNKKYIKKQSSFENIEKKFLNPDNEYRSCPLLVFNEIISESEIDRMIDDLKNNGFGGFFVHPRPGLVTEYKSDEWYSLFQYAVMKGKELGMDVWIYDENSYPSGFAGGHVPSQYPESYNQGQGLLLEKVNLIPENVEQFYLCLLKQANSFIDITPSISKYIGKEGEYYLYKKTYYQKSNWHAGFSYVDLLVPGVTEKFIDVTMKGYEKSIQESFGNVVPGIFTDEPNIVTSGGLRWTPDLFDVFKKKWGYDLQPYLPLLSEEIGEWKMVRYQYMETLLQLFVDRWAKPWFNYTEKHNLKWTGHYWEHGWPNMNDGPDNMAMYAWHQMPGIDMLFNQFNETSPQAQFGNVRAVKELRSVANQMDYKRTLSETYGGGGWDLTFKDLKRLGDWEYVLGVNFMNQHLSHQTLSGARKYDYPPVFTYHSPWWNNYKPLNDYFTRLSFLLSEGTQNNDIVIIEPNSTLWCYYSHTGSSSKLMPIGEKFQSFVTTLEKNQVEYDLASENIIKDQGSINNNNFVIGKASYSTVILPPFTENISRHTFSLLKNFIINGGRVLCFDTPDKIDGIVNKDISELLDSKLVSHFDSLTQDVIERIKSANDIDFTYKDGNLYHHRREFLDGELLFLVNSSMDEKTVGQLTISKGRSIFEFDAFTGNIYSYPFKKDAKRLLTHFEIEPAGSLILFISDDNAKKYPKKKQLIVSETIPATTKTKIKRLQNNAFPIDFCDLVLNSEIIKNIHVSNAADRVFRAHGFESGNPWNTSVQFKRNIIERDTFTSGGFSVLYHFKIDKIVDYSTFQLVTERPHIFSVKINGKEVSSIPNEWWLDKSFGVYNIGNTLKEGINEVELTVKPMRILAEIEPVYILGDFGVIPEKSGWSISSPTTEMNFGSWKNLRLPFYSWDVEYSKEYNMKDIKGNFIVKLGKWAGTVAEVYVNNEKVGIIGFDPFTLDITPYLHSGKNNIAIRVIGSHKNLLGPHYKNPAKGLASPWHWKGIERPVAGEDYQLVDYGLFEDFELTHGL